jgi:hypothetical protein
MQTIFSKRAVDVMFDVITDEANQIGFLNAETKYILCRPIATWVSHFADKMALLARMPTRKTLGLPEPDGRQMVPVSYFLSHDKDSLYFLNHNKANFTPGLRQLQNVVVRMAHLGPGPDSSKQPSRSNDKLNSQPAQNQAQQQTASPAPFSLQATVAELNDTLKTLRENTRSLRQTVTYNITRWKNTITIADQSERQKSRENAHVEAGGRRQDVKPKNMEWDMVEDQIKERRRDRCRHRAREAIRDAFMSEIVPM